MKGGGSISMQCNNSLSSMEMIKSNHLNYNCSTDHHHQNQSSTPSIFNLVNQLIPSSPSPPHVKSHCKKNPRETRRPIIQRKKQVRRRFHTTKPYQERLLNMAEARKEIVTALKFHRASMKKQQEEEEQQQPPPPQPQPSVTIPALMHHIQQQTPLQAPVLPSSNMGVLGLNLSFRFQDYNFTNLDEAALPIGIPTTPHLNDELLISASSVNSSGALLQVDPTMAFEDDCSSSSSAQCEGAVAAAGPRALDDEEMAEMRSIGKKHQMEWDDTLNLATYACWFRFLQEEEGDSLSCQFGDLL